MHPLWKAFFSRRARYTRIGIALLVLALIVWVTIDTVHDHQMPNLAHVGEFLAACAAVFYGIDRLAGQLRNGRNRRDRAR